MSRIVPAILLGTELILFLAPAPAQAQSQDNILIVLDASGSMTQTMSGSHNSRMDEAKQALLTVVKAVPKNTHVGMLIFSSKNLKEDLAYPLGPVDLPKLEQAIRSPEPYDQTPLGAYPKKGADILLKQRETQNGYGTFRLLVVTDGEATDAELVDAFLPDIRARGITIDVIGVDMKSDLALATRVHSYRRADDPEALVKGLTEVLAEIGGTTDDAVSADAFAAIEPIPEEMAKAMLAALVNSTSGNHPIGEAPPPKPAVGAPVVDAVSSSPVAPSYPPGPAPSVPGRPPTQSGGGLGAFTLVCLFMVLVSALVIWAAIKKSQQRG